MCWSESADLIVGAPVVAAGLAGIVLARHRQDVPLAAVPVLLGLHQLIESQIWHDSAGTGSWHVGDGADPRTVATLEGHGYDGSHHRASHFVASSFDGVDLVLAADSGHVRDLRRLARSDEERHRIRLFRSYDATSVAADDLEMADPWYGDTAEFEQCFAEVEAASRGVVAALRDQLVTD